jgi:hypothetical protein
MTQQRRRRLERLEAHQPAGKPWRDPFDLCMLEAVRAGLACWLPSPEPELSPETDHLFGLAMRDADRMAARLAAERAA